MVCDSYILEYEHMKEDRHRFRRLIKLKRNKGKQNDETRSNGATNAVVSPNQTDTSLHTEHPARRGAHHRGDTSSHPIVADRTDDGARGQQSPSKRIVVADELDDLE